MSAFQSELRAFFEDLAERWDAQQPPGEETRQMLLSAGFDDVWGEDTDEHYLASGRG